MACRQQRFPKIPDLRHLRRMAADDSETMPFNLLHEKKRMLLPTLPLAYWNKPSSCIANPLIHFGRHFGRTIHALCNVNVLITNGLLRLGELADEPEDSFTIE